MPQRLALGSVPEAAWANLKRSDAGYYTLAEIIDASFTTIRQIRSEDAETVRLMKVLAAPGNRDPYVRQRSIVFLTGWAADDEDRQKQVAPFVRAGLADPVCQRTCIAAAGTFGPVCRDCLPTLKRLKLSGDEATRKAAADAVDKIENR